MALVGLALFAVAAAAGALASSFVALLVARVVQGAGAGLVSPAALAGAVSGFPPERRGRALGIWGASAGMSNLLGPLLGGVLTVALGWRADWWALVPLTIAAGLAIARLMPVIVHADKRDHPALNRIVLAATLVAGLTFAVMIGAFYIAEQYLQRVAGFSALGASGALVLVALLVGAAAPMAGRLVDRHGEQLPALLGFGASALGLTVLGIPGMTLDGVVTILPLIPVGLGLGMLFVPTSRAALNASPLALTRSHVGAALGRPTARRHRRRRAGRYRAVRDADRLDRSPNTAAGRDAVRLRGPALRDPADRPGRAARRAAHQRLTGGTRDRAGCAAYSGCRRACRWLAHRHDRRRAEWLAPA